MRMLLNGLVNAVCLFGGWAVLHAIHLLTDPVSFPYHHELLILTICFTFMSLWSVRLPSGSSWRPAMMFVTVSLLLVPYGISILMAVPGLILITLRSKGNWKGYFLTFGHIGLGLYGGGMVFHLLNPTGSLDLSSTTSLISILAALASHLAINRVVSLVIIADRERRSLNKQFRLVVKDLHWGYFNLYLLSILSSFVYKEIGVVGLIISILLLMGMYRSLSYYTRVHKLENAVYIDSLTKVENRSSWESFLVAMDKRPLTGTISMIDLNDFKLVNDTLGHSEGDKLLRETATYMRGSLRDRDRIFRYGGDEFIIFIPHEQGMEELINKRVDTLVSKMCDSVRINKLPIQASVGCASYPEDASSFKDIIPIADKRMYANKVKNKQKQEQIKTSL